MKSFLPIHGLPSLIGVVALFGTLHINPVNALTELLDIVKVTPSTSGTALPGEVEINLQSDFNMDQLTQSPGTAWIEWSVATSDSTGLNLYSVPAGSTSNVESVLTDGSGVATFTLTEGGDKPLVGETIITINAKLKYNNNMGEITGQNEMIMHERDYIITLTVTGDDNVQAIATSGSSTTEYTVTEDEEVATGLLVTPLPEGGIRLASTNAVAVAFGTAIELKADQDDVNYRLWLDGPVEVYDAETGGNLLYTWPNALVSAIKEEEGSAKDLVMTLNAVPIALYNAETIYVRCTVGYRDIEGDADFVAGGRTRALRMVGSSSTTSSSTSTFDSSSSSSSSSSSALSSLSTSRALEGEYTASRTGLETQIKLQALDDDGSSDASAMSMMGAAAMAAGAGVALLI